MQKKLPTSKLPRAVNQLLASLRASFTSASRFEDRFWQSHLEQLIQAHLSAGQDDVIESALTELATIDTDQAHEWLEHVQAASQNLNIEIDGQKWQVLLVTSAFSVWTRYQLPQVTLTKDDEAYLAQGIKQTVLAPNAVVQVLPQLLGLDEMPRSYSETYQWLERLTNRAFGKRTALPKTVTLEPNPALLVDTRHLLFAAAVPEGEPLFRWQADVQVSESQCQDEWIAHVTPRLSLRMPGCQFHALTPRAYHSGVELSEQHIRMVAIDCASSWLHSTLELKPGDLRACIAAVGERTAQEYRVGYYRAGQTAVIYGTIWPVLEDEDMQQSSAIDTFDEITEVLKESGVSHVTRIPGILWPESCDDCTAPFFPNVSGELVHIDLPDEVFDAPQHFH